MSPGDKIDHPDVETMTNNNSAVVTKAGVITRAAGPVANGDTGTGVCSGVNVGTVGCSDSKSGAGVVEGDGPGAEFKLRPGPSP